MQTVRGYPIVRKKDIMADTIRVLYVDDQSDLLDIGKLFLERGGQFSVDIITSAPTSLTLLNTKKYDAIISDYQMPGMDEIMTGSRIKRIER